MAKRSDDNQPAIVQALRAAGASVHDTHELGAGFPDIIAGFRKQNYLLEIKRPGAKLTADEMDWHIKWRGLVYVVENETQALAAIGAIAYAARTRQKTDWEQLERREDAR